MYHEGKMAKAYHSENSVCSLLTFVQNDKFMFIADICAYTLYAFVHFGKFCCRRERAKQI